MPTRQGRRSAKNLRIFERHACGSLPYHPHQRREAERPTSQNRYQYLTHGRLPSIWFVSTQPSYGTSMPQSGRRPPHHSPRFGRSGRMSALPPNNGLMSDIAACQKRAKSDRELVQQLHLLFLEFSVPSLAHFPWRAFWRGSAPAARRANNPRGHWVSTVASWLTAPTFRSAIQF